MSQVLTDFNWTRAIVVSIVIGFIFPSVLDSVGQVIYVWSDGDFTQLWEFISFIFVTIFLCMCSIAYFWDQPRNFASGALLGLVFMAYFFVETLFMENVMRQIRVSNSYSEFDSTFVLATLEVMVGLGIFGWLLGFLEKRVR